MLQQENEILLKLKNSSFLFIKRDKFHLFENLTNSIALHIIYFTSILCKYCWVCRLINTFDGDFLRISNY